MGSLFSSRFFRAIVLALAAFVLLRVVLGIMERPGLSGTPPAIDARTIDGQSVSLASLHGKVVLIDFWATWCRPCIAEIPHIRRVYEQHHASGFEVIGVSLDQNRDALKAFLARERLPWPQIFDADAPPGQRLAERYGVKFIPHTLLIGRDGQIIASSLRGSELDRAVTKALRSPS